MRYMIVASVLGSLLLSCASSPPGGSSPADPAARVSYVRDAEDPLELPSLSATIVNANVDVAMEWDEAHNQFLEELIHSGIFRSVVLEPLDLVDYGAGFSLTTLPGGGMQVQMTFVNMHTGDIVFNGVTRGNVRNGHFGFAYIEGTDTAFDDALAVQTALARAVSEYTVQADDMSGSSIAVLDPVVDRAGLPNDQDFVQAFDAVADGRFLAMIEDFLFNITGADLAGRQTVSQAVRDMNLAPVDLFDQEQAAAVGRRAGADYVLMSRLAYDPDGYFLVDLKVVDAELSSLFRSAVFQANLWSAEATGFDVGTQIDRMFHRRGPRAAVGGRSEKTAGTGVPNAPVTGSSAAASGSPGKTGFGDITIHIDPVFPVLYSYYDRNPIGYATITNSGSAAVEDIVLSVYVDQYMDNPKASEPLARLEAGATERIGLFGLFTSDILEITEGARLSALVGLRYSTGNAASTEQYVQTIEVLNRNAMTWDDDRKIAAFVTSRDPAVMSFARNVSGLTRESANPGINDNLAVAMGLHEALDSYGIHYVPDPVTSYIEYSAKPTAVDYLLFPRQTLEFRGGDCDDLSALYSALLESVGIETAFVTTPGHIFVAVSLGMGPERARNTFLHPDELIFMDDAAWLPVEVTVRGQGFLAAWQQGAKEWRENEPAGQAGFFPVREAWKIFQPVGLPGTTSLEPLERENLGATVSSGLARIVEREIDGSRSALEARQASDPMDPRWPNKLGVLYGRYGMYDTAAGYFRRALDIADSYVPALINLGNVSLLSGDPTQALDYYAAARAVEPDNPDVLLSVARANHALENYGTARMAYERLQEIAPEVAGMFSYLNLRGEEAARAAEAQDEEDLVLWGDEQDGE